MNDSRMRAVGTMRLRRVTRITLAVLMALTSVTVTAFAAGNVRSGRAHLGMIGFSHSNSFGGTSISFAVSTNGKSFQFNAV